MAAMVVLYALLTRVWFSTGTRPSTAYNATMMVIATTIIISSRLKPLARCRLRLALIFSCFNPILLAPAKQVIHAAILARSSTDHPRIHGPVMSMLGTGCAYVKVPGYSGPSYTIL